MCITEYFTVFTIAILTKPWRLSQKSFFFAKKLAKGYWKKSLKAITAIYILTPWLEWFTKPQPEALVILHDIFCLFETFWDLIAFKTFGNILLLNYFVILKIICSHLFSWILIELIFQNQVKWKCFNQLKYSCWIRSIH